METPDRVTELGNSVVQHGPLSNRVYLMSLDESDCPEIVGRIDELALRRGYTKVFAKVPAGSKRCFLDNGYDEEAAVPGFFRGEEDGVFLGKYLTDSRAVAPDESGLADVVRVAREKAADPAPAPELPARVRLGIAGSDDAEALAALYAEVFESYPFPIHDPAYIRKTMEEGVTYATAWMDGELLGTASAEPDFDAGNAEMTDFAVSRRHRGLALARHLLGLLEENMVDKGVVTFYTIARAMSYGMNVTFAREGYRFAGTLVNNTNIAGGIESMNVWFKHPR